MNIFTFLFITMQADHFFWFAWPHTKETLQGRSHLYTKRNINNTLEKKNKKKRETIKR